MSSIAAEQELYYACKVIFGPELNVSREFLEYLQPAGIKSAYRQKARETHPDLVAADLAAPLDRRNGDLFLEVKDAYEKLTAYLSARENGFRLPDLPGCTPSQRHENHSRNRNGFRPHRRKPRYNWQWNANSLYHGPLPTRKLLLGHFLYYSGIATWQAIAQALIWQRSHRPLAGELCRRYGWLTDTDTGLILKNRSMLEPFGQTALKLGLLSPDQVKTILRRQRLLQKRIGAFFVEKGILTPEELRTLLAEHRHHNAVFSSPVSRNIYRQ